MVRGGRTQDIAMPRGACEQRHTPGLTSASVLPAPSLGKTNPRGIPMLCANADEIDLIRMLDASRYADPLTLCSTSCRQSLNWSDWETDVAKAMYEVLRHLENVLRSNI